MWLDRFSAHSTPSATPPPQGRSYSPAPRRPYLTPGAALPRSGTNPRSASLLSLASSASSTTDLPTARIPNGSALRNQVYAAPPDDVPDPVQVLESIIGVPLKKKEFEPGDEDGELSINRPLELVEDVDFDGLSLEAFLEADGGDLRTRHPTNTHIHSAQSIDEYDKEKDKFEDLHRSILACDEVLKSVETYLTGFQSDLGAVSAEIETLQSRSTSLNTKLENRRVVEKLLGPALEEFSISPGVVQKIAEGPIDEGWIEALAELEKRSKAINAKSQEQRKIKAVEDLKPLLDDLTNKAVERIRDYLVAQIKAIRSPSINAQTIQQEAFAKYKELFAFLAKHQSQLAEEIIQAYINTMRWYYLHNFTRYRDALSKLKLHVIDKHDVLAHDDSNVKRGGSTILGSNRVPVAPHDAFSIGRRLDVLKNPSKGALTSYVAEEDKSTHYLETPFRAFNLALIDNASFEYTFLNNFLSPSQSFHAISRNFYSIFSPTFSLAESLTRSLIDTTVDALGILLCVRLNQHFAFELQRRKVPAVEGYINATNMLLWPRFQIVMDLHCDSLRRATSSLPGRPAASSILTSSPASSQSTAPHPLTQRFANFMHGILALSSEAGDDEPVSNSLGRLRAEFEAYLTKLSKGIGDQRKRERFLENNYSLVATIVADADGKLAEEMKRHFGQLKDAFKT